MLTRRVQLVSTKSEGKAVIPWMVARKEENGSDSTIGVLAVEQLPSVFRQTNRRANREKARQRTIFFLLLQLCRTNDCL